jgi:Bacterial PH domain
MTSPATVPVTSGARDVLRLVPPVILWWLWVAFLALNVADFAIQGLSSPRFGAVVSAVLLLVTGLMYTLALRPRVICDGTGVTVENPFRVHRVPWRLIQTVDAAEWVRLHYAADGDGAALDTPRSSAGAKRLNCWALYVSARTRRRSTRPAAPRPRRGVWRNPEAIVGGYAQPSSKLPDEARYLASLPPVLAMASRLDARAARERAAARLGPDGPAGQADAAPGTTAHAAWSWPALAAVVIPALILLVVVLV